jgi:phosphohistidine phosphatase
VNLYLLRHGLARDPSPQGFAKDSDRPLTPEGERKLRKIAEGMAALELAVDLILSSPYRRARQTAEIVAEALKGRKRLRFSDTLAPGGSMQKLIGLVEKLEPPAENVLLVGHEPYLSELISFLVAGHSGFAVVMKKGGLCKISAESLQPSRCAALKWLLTPKQLVLLG